MTKQIRSEKAIRYLNRCFLAGNTKESRKYKAYNRDMCEESLRRCESDARDRAVRAFCLSQCGEMKCKLRSTCHPFKEFKQACDNE